MASREIQKIVAKKSLGQHFLNNPSVPKCMADAGKVEKNDIILEIGPGTGMLTRELLDRGAQVVAIETDKRAVAVLESEFLSEISAKRLLLVHCDVRNIDLSSLKLKNHSYKLISNIPYYLSGMLFRLFLEHKIQPSDIVFLVQREVGERIACDTKESLLSLSIKVFGDPKYIKTIKKGNFTPQPSIDSAIIGISGISNDRFEGLSREFFFTILHEGFKSKRKQLLGNLAERFNRETLVSIFETLDIDTKIRGEDVSLTTWIALCKEIQIHTPSTSHSQS